MGKNKREAAYENMQKAAYDVTAGLWLRGLLDLAKENKGEVVISIPSLDLKFPVTQKKIEKLIRKKQKKSKP